MEEKTIHCLWGFPRQEIQRRLDGGETVVVFSASCDVSLCMHVFYEEDRCDLVSFQQICRENVFRPFSYEIHGEIQDQQKAQINEMVMRCQLVEWQTQLEGCVQRDFGIETYRNVLHVAHKQVDKSSFHQMRGCLKQIPAVICGGGPSLTRDLHSMLEDKAVVFAGGSSLRIVSRWGGKVHIAAGIDPNPDYDVATLPLDKDMPFFYQGRCSSTVLDRMQGPCFQVPSNSLDILPLWLEENDPFDGGWTVTTFCFALALHFGCNPIILSGVDHAYSMDGRVYADEPLQREGVAWYDRQQGWVRTQRDWVLAVKWLEEKMAQHTDRSFYTASFSGIIPHGLQYISPEDLCCFLDAKSYDIQKCMDHIKSRWRAESTVFPRMQVLQESIDQGRRLIQELLLIWEGTYPRDPCNTAEYWLHSVQLESQLAYQLILEPVWRIWQCPLSRQVGKEMLPLHRLLFFQRVLDRYRSCV